MEYVDFFCRVPAETSFRPPEQWFRLLCRVSFRSRCVRLLVVDFSNSRSLLNPSWGNVILRLIAGSAAPGMIRPSCRFPCSIRPGLLSLGSPIPSSPSPLNWVR